MNGNTHRFAWAEIDLAAYRRNIERLARAGRGETWAVVKADAYGHGAVEGARADDGGAHDLAQRLRGDVLVRHHLF